MYYFLVIYIPEHSLSTWKFFNIEGQKLSDGHPVGRKVSEVSEGRGGASKKNKKRKGHDRPFL